MVTVSEPSLRWTINYAMVKNHVYEVIFSISALYANYCAHVLRNEAWLACQLFTYIFFSKPTLIYSNKMNLFH